HAVGFQDNVRDYYAMADAFVFPSHREGFPNVILQAGAMELNAIVTDINGSREIVSNGKNGWVIPVNDVDKLKERMLWCMQNQNSSLRMGKASREIIKQKFEQQLVWRALLKEYNNV